MVCRVPCARSGGPNVRPLVGPLMRSGCSAFRYVQCKGINRKDNEISAPSYAYQNDQTSVPSAIKPWPRDCHQSQLGIVHAHCSHKSSLSLPVGALAQPSPSPRPPILAPLARRPPRWPAPGGVVSASARIPSALRAPTPISRCVAARAARAGRRSCRRARSASPGSQPHSPEELAVRAT